MLYANAQRGMRSTFFWYVRSLLAYGESVRADLTYISMGPWVLVFGHDSKGHSTWRLGAIVIAAICCNL